MRTKLHDYTDPAGGVLRRALLDQSVPTPLQKSSIVDGLTGGLPSVAADPVTVFCTFEFEESVFDYTGVAREQCWH